MDIKEAGNKVPRLIMQPVSAQPKRNKIKSTARKLDNERQHSSYVIDNGGDQVIK